MSGRILRSFKSVFGAKIGILFLGLVTTPLLVRLLGSGQYGDYAFLLSVLSITMILTNAGIFDGTRKYIAEDRTQQYWTERVFGFYFRIAGILAVIAVGAYLSITWLGVSDLLFGSDYTVYLYLISILIFFRQANSVARGGLMGLGLEHRSEPLQILNRVLFAFFGLGLAFLGYGVAGVLAGHILAMLLVSIVSFAILSRHIDLKYVYKGTPSGFPRIDLLSFNVLSIALILLTSSLYHVDILLLRLLSGDEATGFYKAALVIAEFLWFVPNALQTVLLHSSSDLWSNDRTEEISALASDTTRYNLLSLALLLIGISALAEDFVVLYYGPNFESSVLPLLLLLPGALGFALARPIFAIGQGKGELRILIVATGVAALLNLCLNLLLIPRYGTAGAAMATSVSYGLMFFLHAWAAIQIGFNPIDDLRLARVTGVVVPSAVVIFGTAILIESPILSLLIVPPVGFVTYAVLALKLSAITPSEIEVFTRRLPDPIQKYYHLTLRMLSV